MSNQIAIRRGIPRQRTLGRRDVNCPCHHIQVPDYILRRYGNHRVDNDDFYYNKMAHIYERAHMQPIYGQSGSTIFGSGRFKLQKYINIDILDHITDWLNPRDLANLAATCRFMYGLLRAIYAVKPKPARPTPTLEDLYERHNKFMKSHNRSYNWSGSQLNERVQLTVDGTVIDEYYPQREWELEQIRNQFRLPPGRTDWSHIIGDGAYGHRDSAYGHHNAPQFGTTQEFTIDNVEHGFVAPMYINMSFPRIGN